MMKIILFIHAELPLLPLLRSDKTDIYLYKMTAGKKLKFDDAE